MKINDVVAYLDDRFHPEYQEDYDNAGFLVGDGSAEYKGALVALDLTEAVVAEAKAAGLNLIVTHHPLIFGGLKSVTSRTATGRMVIDMLRSGIAAYAAHTNLDNMPDGVNGVLCEKLGLGNTRILRASAECGVRSEELAGASQLPTAHCPLNTQHSTLNTEIGAGMIGELKQETGTEEFMQTVKRRLGLPWLRLSGERKTVRRVAVCGGAGSFLISDALTAGADVYLTGDLKYHDFQRPEGRMLLVDIGHYESEQFAREIISRAISEKFSNFACRISECQHSVVHYM